MDLSALPNNNHPDKFLQLDVKLLMRNSALLQASLVRFPGGNYPAAQHWQNLVYSQVRSGSPRTGLRTGSGSGWGVLSHSLPFQHLCKRKAGGNRGQGSLLNLATEQRSFFLNIRNSPITLWKMWILPPIHSPANISFPACLHFRVCLALTLLFSGFFKPICK